MLCPVVPLCGAFTYQVSSKLACRQDLLDGITCLCIHIFLGNSKCGKIDSFAVTLHTLRVAHLLAIPHLAFKNGK
jgi:hypothetical protein